MSKKRKNNFKLCPECGAYLEIKEKKVNRDGVMYATKIYECDECGYSNLRKQKRDNISVRDW